MFYRENGQFKTSYRADQQIFPIAQDRIALFVMLAIGFVAVPMMASDYMFRAILIPFLIFSLAAVGVNILVGYCGQISLGRSWRWAPMRHTTSLSALTACRSSWR
jgi:branched-chain amino acid transport system permease protein